MTDATPARAKTRLGRGQEEVEEERPEPVEPGAERPHVVPRRGEDGHTDELAVLLPSDDAAPAAVGGFERAGPRLVEACKERSLRPGGATTTATSAGRPGQAEPTRSPS